MQNRHGTSQNGHFFVTLFNYFSKALSNIIASSVILSSIRRNCDLKKSFSGSYTARVFRKLEGFFPILLKLRLAFAKKCENSVLANSLESFYHRFLSQPLRTIGVYLLTFGAVMLTYSATGFDSFPVLNDSTVFALIVIFGAFLILPVKKSIGSCIKASRLLCFLYPESSEKSNVFSQKDIKNQAFGYSTAFFLGMLCGIFSYIIPPVKILSFITAILLSLIFINNPESSLLFTIFTLPILSASYIIFFEAVTFISILGKYMRAKRHISFCLSDIFMLLTALLLFSSFRFTVFGEFNSIQMLKYLFGIMLYFLVKNIIRSTELARRCISIILYSSAAVSFLNILCALLSDSQYGIYLSIMTDTRPGAVSFFSTSLSLGIYLTSLIPIAFSMLLGTGNLKYLFITLLHLGCIFILCGTFFLYTAVFSVLLVLCFYSKGWLITLPFYKFISDCAINLLSLLPKLSSADNAFLSFPHEYATVSAKIFKEHFLFGTGMGDSTLFKAANAYSDPYTAMKFVQSPFILQALIALGGIGIIFCGIAILQLIGKNLSFIVSPYPKESTVFSASIGAFASSICLIICGFFACSFDDTRIMMLFWLVLTLGVSFGSSSKNDYISPYSAVMYKQNYIAD